MSVLEREFWIQYFFCIHQILLDRNTSYYQNILEGCLRIIPFHACFRAYQLRDWARELNLTHTPKENQEASKLFFAIIQYLRKTPLDQLTWLTINDKL